MKTMTISRDDRLSILGYARRFTSDPADAAAVAINAGPLLAFAEDAEDAEDLKLRIRALMHQSFTGEAGAHSPTADNPDEFVRRVRILYAFATAGEVHS